MTFPIAWNKALEGCKLAIDNAKRLADDAELLEQNGRLASAFAASINAWEELGKAVLLYRYWKEKRDISENEWTKIFCNHRRKRAAWVNSTDIVFQSKPRKPIEKLKNDLTEASKEWGEWFNLEREVGVYVDWRRDWRSPCRISFQFPFEPGYWIFCVRSSSMDLEEVLSQTAA